MKPAPVVLLMGPTASGKSDLALDLATRYPVEIVSVDSAQIYRGMDIGTAKPDAATRARIPHHLIDIIDPDQAYSAARFTEDALRVIAEVRGRGHVPLLVGGTMLYFKALVQGLSALPPADAATRARIDARAAVEGWPALHAELARVDALTAARIHATDAQRIQRALEVFMLTGQPLSTLQAARAAPVLGPTLTFALMPADRARLHRAIARRFEAMLAAGLVEEVRALRDRYRLRADMPSMRAVGYRQVWQTLEGTEPAATLVARGVAATRQLAKRQYTWLRALNTPSFDPWSEPAAERIADAISLAMRP